MPAHERGDVAQEGSVLTQCGRCGRGFPRVERHASAPEIPANRLDPVHYARPRDLGSRESGGLKPLYLEEKIASVPFNPYSPGRKGSFKLRIDRVTGGSIADRHGPYSTPRGRGRRKDRAAGRRVRPPLPPLGVLRPTGLCSGCLLRHPGHRVHFEPLTAHRGTVVILPRATLAGGDRFALRRALAQVFPACLQNVADDLGHGESSFREGSSTIGRHLRIVVAHGAEVFRRHW